MNRSASPVHPVATLQRLSHDGEWNGQLPPLALARIAGDESVQLSALTAGAPTGASLEQAESARLFLHGLDLPLKLRKADHGILLLEESLLEARIQRQQICQPADH